MHVSLFVTCVVDLFAPEVGGATVQVLRSIGAEVTVPAGQTCCGQPAWNSGFAGDAGRVAAQSLAALTAALDAHPDTWIVVPAGSCATMIRVFWPELFSTLGDEARAAQAQRVAERTRELSEFLDGPSAGWARPEAPAGPVAYHHSCHMLRELRIDGAPERLVDAAGGQRLDWSADRRCCGFGGLFSFKLPEVSVAMADDKLTTLPTAADGTTATVVGCDTSCLMHLRARAAHEGRPITTRHLAEVLADAHLGPASGAAAGGGAPPEAGAGIADGNQADDEGRGQ